MSSPAWEQKYFRWRLDDANEVNATWTQVQDTNDAYTIPYGTTTVTRRIRFTLSLTTASETEGFYLYAQKNGTGGYARVTTGTTGCKIVTSSNFADGDSTTRQLTLAGTFDTTNLGMDEDGAIGSQSWTKNYSFEAEFCIQFYGTINDGDYWDFRVYRDDGTTTGFTYTVTPRIVLSKSPVWESKAIRLRNDDGNETGATWYGAQDLSAYDVYGKAGATSNFRARYKLLNTVKGETEGFHLYLNNAGWSRITTGSSLIKSQDSAYVADGDNTTEQLTPTVAIVTNNGGIDENGAVAAIAYAVTEATELEWAIGLTFPAGETTSRQVELRVYRDSGVDLDIVTKAIVLNIYTYEIKQKHFRIRKDDGNETGATWWANEDTNYATMAPNTRLRIRFKIKMGWTEASEGFKLFCSRNSGAYAEVTSGGTYAQTALSSWFADNDNCTEQLTSEGSFATTNYGMDENGSTAATSWSNQYTGELEFCILLTSSCANNDTFDFRVYRDDGTPLEVYDTNKTPRITTTVSYDQLTATLPIGMTGTAAATRTRNFSKTVAIGMTGTAAANATKKLSGTASIGMTGTAAAARYKGFSGTVAIGLTGSAAANKMVSFTGSITVDMGITLSDVTPDILILCNDNAADTNVYDTISATNGTLSSGTTAAISTASGKIGRAFTGMGMAIPGQYANGFNGYDLSAVGTTTHAFIELWYNWFGDSTSGCLVLVQQCPSFWQMCELTIYGNTKMAFGIGSSTSGTDGAFDIATKGTTGWHQACFYINTTLSTHRVRGWHDGVEQNCAEYHDNLTVYPDLSGTTFGIGQRIGSASLGTGWPNGLDLVRARKGVLADPQALVDALWNDGNGTADATVQISSFYGGASAYRARNQSGTISISLNGTADTDATKSLAGTCSIGLTGTAVGYKSRSLSGTASLSMSGTATGKAVKAFSGTLSVGLTGTATAEHQREFVGTVSIGMEANTPFTPSAHWKLNDNAVTVTVVESVNGYNGSANVFTNTLSTAGKLNQAFNWSAGTEYATLSTAATADITGTTASIAFWAYVPTGYVNGKFLLQKTDVTSASKGWVFTVNTGDKIRFYASNGSWVYTEKSITLDAWIHVIGVMDGTNITLYIGGAGSTPTLFAKSYDDSTYTIWLHQSTAGSGTACKTDDVRWYPDVVLSADQRAAIYNGGDGTEETTLYTGGTSAYRHRGLSVTTPISMEGNAAAWRARGYGGTISINLTGTAAGSKSAQKEFSGTAAINLTGTSAGYRARQLSGTIAVGLTGTAVSTATRALTGTAAIGMTGTAAGDRTRQLAGTATIGMTGTADTDATKALSGTAAIGLTGNAAGYKTRPLAGTVALSMTGTAASESAKAISSTVALNLTGGVAGYKTRPLSGTAAISLSGTAVVYKARELSKTVALSLTGTQAAYRARQLAGTIPIGMTGTAAAQKGGQVELAGTAAIGLAGTAAANAIKALSGTTALSMTGTAAAARYVGLSSTASISLTGTSTAYRARQLSGTTAIEMTGVAGATSIKSFSGTITVGMVSATPFTALAHYRCNDNSADHVVVDSSTEGGGAANMTSTLHTDAITAAGKISTALAGKFIRDAGSKLYMTGPFSVAFWTYIATGVNADHILFDTNGTGGWMVRHQAATINFSIYYGASYKQVATNTIYDQFVHYVVVYDGSQISIYANSVQGTPVSMDGNSLLPYDGQFQVMHASSAARIDDLRFYDYALSTDQIAASYNGGDGTEVTTLYILGGGASAYRQRGLSATAPISMEGTAAAWRARQLSGVVAIDLAGTAASKATKALAATASISLTGAAAGYKVRPLAGTIAISMTGTADADSQDSLAGTVPIGLSGTAAAYRARGLSSTVALGLAGTADADATKALAGTAAVTLTGEASAYKGTLRALSGTAAIGMTGTAAGSRARQLSATAALSLTGTAAAKATKSLSGTAAIALTGAATAYRARQLASVVALDLTGAATARATKVLAGTVPLSLTGSSSAYRARQLAATVSIDLTGSAAAKVEKSLAGTVAVSLTGASAGYRARGLSGTTAIGLTGVAAGYRARQLTGTAAIGLTGTAAAKAIKGLSSTVSLSMAGSADAFEGQVESLTGTIALGLTGTAAAYRYRGLSSTVSLSMAGSAATIATRALAGTVAIGLTGAVTAYRARQLSGTAAIGMTGTAEANKGTQHALAGTAVLDMTGTAAAKAIKAFTGTVGIGATGAASAYRARQLSGQVPVSLVGAAAVNAIKAFAGAAPISMLGTAAGYRARGLSGDIVVDLSGTAGVDAIKAFSATVPVNLFGTAAAVRPRDLSGLVPIEMLGIAAALRGKALSGAIPLTLSGTAAAYRVKGVPAISDMGYIPDGAAVGMLRPVVTIESLTPDLSVGSLAPKPMIGKKRG